MHPKHLNNIPALPRRLTVTGPVLVIALLSTLLLSCNQQELEDIPVDYGYEYYPLEVGRSWTYQVDSITFDPAVGGTAIDSFRTFLREVIVDTLLDAAGQTQYRVEQYYRRHDSLPWQISKVLTMAREERRALRTEDNLKFVKIPFPIKDADTWDGNQFFDEQTTFVLIRGEQVAMFKDWAYSVLQEGKQAIIGDLEFEEVANLQNADDESQIERRYAIEQYAKNVGLIYRELEILDTQCQVCCASDFETCEGIPWRDKAEKGMIVRQQLIRYE